MNLSNLNLNTHKIGFIGCGNMASAIIRGLVSGGFPASQLSVSNPSTEKLKQLSLETNIQTTSNNQEVADFSDILVLAIKPQVLPQVCEQLKDANLTNKLIISIAAGITPDKIAE